MSIDVRKTSSVSVNLLTYVESFRLRYLVQSGMPFDSAKTQAKREVLDAFGFYDEPLDYEKKGVSPIKKTGNFWRKMYPSRGPSLETKAGVALDIWI